MSWEARRRSDWIDTPGGRVRMGPGRSIIDPVYAAIPDHGPSATLLRLAAELVGNQPRQLTRVLLNVHKG